MAPTGRHNYPCGATNSYTHDHADELSFDLWNGGPIHIDSGKYSYNHGKWRNYFLGNSAHNTAGIPDTHFSPSTP